MIGRLMRRALMVLPLTALLLAACVDAVSAQVPAPGRDSLHPVGREVLERAEAILS